MERLRLFSVFHSQFGLLGIFRRVAPSLTPAPGHTPSSSGQTPRPRPAPSRTHCRQRCPCREYPIHMYVNTNLIPNTKFGFCQHQLSYHADPLIYHDFILKESKVKLYCYQYMWFRFKFLFLLFCFVFTPLISARFKESQNFRLLRLLVLLTSRVYIFKFQGYQGGAPGSTPPSGPMPPPSSAGGPGYYPGAPPSSKPSGPPNASVPPNGPPMGSRGPGFPYGPGGPRPMYPPGNNDP